MKIESKIAGLLKPSEHDESYFESGPIEIPYFENKKLKIGFVEAEHIPYLTVADGILENFLQLQSIDRLKDSGIIKGYYDEILKYGYTNPLNFFSDADIWNYVKPIEVVIHWDEQEDFYLCVSCECEWEEEHGLQLVFKNGLTLTRATGNDGAFTD